MENWDELSGTEGVNITTTIYFEYRRKLLESPSLGRNGIN